MELMTLKPLLASKLNVSGFSPMHLALQNNHIPLVLKLLHRTVNVKAKNLDGKTAMDILQTHQSPCFPEARRLLHSVKEKLL
uniref:Uncharacterized protein n=1 Tax=Brassica campestris TaxID=3711 RepID=M4F2G3_BRACM